MYTDSLVTKILKIKVIKQDTAGHKTYRRHIPFITYNKSLHKCDFDKIMSSYKAFKFQWQNLILDDRSGLGLISISPDNKSRRCLKLFMKYLIVDI